MGKGDHRRPSSVSEEEYAKNYEAIFGKKEIVTWDPEATDEGTVSPQSTAGSGGSGGEGEDGDKGGGTE